VNEPNQPALPHAPMAGADAAAWCDPSRPQVYRWLYQRGRADQEVRQLPNEVSSGNTAPSSAHIGQRSTKSGVAPA